MESPHDVRNITSAVVNQKILVKNTVLLVVIELKSSSLLATENGSESLIDQALSPNGQVLLQVVVQGDAMVNGLEVLNLVLQVGALQLLLDSLE